MTRAKMRLLQFVLVTAAGAGALLGSEQAIRTTTGPLVSQASAVIGRPLTPLSYAGVARRTTRRAVAVGAAVGAAAGRPRSRRPLLRADGRRVRPRLHALSLNERAL